MALPLLGGAGPTLRLCEETDVEDIIGNVPAGTIDNLINIASDWVERIYCHRRFKAETGIIEIYSGNGQRWLYLRQPPVSAVTTVEFRTGSASWFSQNIDYLYLDYNDFDSTNDTMKAEQTMGRIYWQNGVFTRGNHNIRITYNGGITTLTTELPATLVRGTALLVAAMYNTKGFGGPLIGSRTMATGETISRAVTDIMTEEIRMFLDPWRRQEISAWE
jgi:hypothetical protein